MGARWSTGASPFPKWARRAIKLSHGGVGKRVMAQVGLVIVRGTKDRMKNAVSPTGKPHLELSVMWRELKRREGRSERIWQYTGESRRKVAVVKGKTSGWSVTVEIGTPWSATANDVRPVLGVSDEDRQAIGQLVLDAAKAAIEEGSGG